MDTSQITNPIKLHDWVREHTRSEEDFEQFVDTLREFFAVVEKECPGLPMSMSVNSGTLFMKDGAQLTVFFINFRSEDEKEPGSFCYAIKVDEETGKLGEMLYISQDTPQMPMRHLQ